MKHTFTRGQVKTIILEEMQADLLIENTTNQIIEEGVLDTIENLKNKYFPNKSDDQIEKELDDVESNPKTLNTMPRSKRIGILFLVGFLGGGVEQGVFDYSELSSAAASDAQRIKSSLQQSAEQSKDVQNFMQMAAAEAESGTATTPEEVDAKIKEIIKTYGGSVDVAPISPGRGIFIGGDPSKGNLEGFAYVPASQIPDDETMPFMGISKKDYETLLRATFLSGPGGDERLENLVMGKGAKGSSGFWAYDNNKLFQGYTADSPYAMLPLEWSVAYELLNKRKSRGRL
jgi:hypothetical protein